MSSMARIRAAGGRLLRRVGVDPIPVGSLRHPFERRRRLLKRLCIDLVIDVGAHEGEYASELRTIGYEGRILSFEPLREAYERLSRRARDDAGWDAIQAAIGRSPGRALLNVAANRGASSSFLGMLDELVRDAPEAAYIGAEDVTIRRLDEACRDASRASAAVFLKADVQGYELEVLQSSSGILADIVGLQLEMSLVQLYSGAPTYMAVIEHAASLGFDLVGLEPGFSATDGRLLQADGLFERREMAATC